MLFFCVLWSVWALRAVYSNGKLLGFGGIMKCIDKSNCKMLAFGGFMSVGVLRALYSKGKMLVFHGFMKCAICKNPIQ